MIAQRLVALVVLVSVSLAGCAPSPQSDASTASVVDKGPGAKQGWTTLGSRSGESVSSQTIHGPVGSWADYDPPTTYAGLVTQNDIDLTMADGVGIALNVTRPTDASGAPATAPLPTIVTFTPYNKNVGGSIPLGGAVSPYFVQHGYNQVFIDVRGTGRSGGSWDPFSAAEQADYGPVLDWIVQQPWSNGVIGMWGLSATATTAMLAAGQKHPAIKSVFAIVPMGDVYRDVVFVGGQASVAFLPAWMSVVTLVATLDPMFYNDPAQYMTAVSEHLAGAGDFIVPRTVGVLAGQPDSAYDNAYWGTKSPLEIDRDIEAPTFIVGGLFDIFQRSELPNYEALKDHTTAKVLIGPWNHLDAAVGKGLPMQGVPTLEHIALQWFDRYLKDARNGAEDLPNVTQWVWGDEHFHTSSDWPRADASAQRWFLQGGGALATSTPAADAAPALVVQEPFNGVCSESSLQISLGLLGNVPLPCWYEDNTAQTLEATFDTAPLADDLYINGPIQADIWMSTTALNAAIVVRVSDLDEGGTAKALSSGLQTASLRAVDEKKSRYLDGQMIQPWHPFTQDTEQALGTGEIVKVPVEIFQTSALIPKGHRLRISVGASDFPFAAPTATNLVESAAGVLSVYDDAVHASSIVLPVVPAASLR